MSETSNIESKETLNLTEWELGNLHLPPVTTVTLYEGSGTVRRPRRRRNPAFDNGRPIGRTGFGDALTVNAPCKCWLRSGFHALTKANNHIFRQPR
jgi:hypothetical protein